MYRRNQTCQEWKGLYLIVAFIRSVDWGVTGSLSFLIQGWTFICLETNQLSSHGKGVKNVSKQNAYV